MRNSRLFTLGIIITILLLAKCTQRPHANFSVSDVNTFMDEWHRDVANTRLDAFFNKMAPDAYYLGTQYDEHWNKKEFYTFCKPYFDRGKAWDFKPVSRNVYYTSDSSDVYFDEVLETWMGLCRGSGIIDASGDSLLIRQYVLSVSISNQLVKDFVELVKSDPANAFLNDSL